MCAFLVVMYLKDFYTSEQERMIAFKGIFKDTYKKNLCEYQWMKTYIYNNQWQKNKLDTNNFSAYMVYENVM